MNQPLILILLGAPGAGKGTVAQFLKDNYDVCHFSTGNLLRAEVKSRSDIGLEIEQILGSGGLVKDDVVNRLVELNIDRVIGSADVIILDGYPRTVEQARVLDSARNGSLRDSVRVIELDVPDEAVVARISQRRVCEKCGNTYGPHDKIEVCSCGGRLIKRKDDEESVVRNRLIEYKKATRPVADYFDDRLVRVSGEGAPSDVAKRVEAVMSQFGIEKRR